MGSHGDDTSDSNAILIIHWFAAACQWGHNTFLFMLHIREKDITNHVFLPLRLKQQSTLGKLIVCLVLKCKFIIPLKTLREFERQQLFRVDHTSSLIGWEIRKNWINYRWRKPDPALAGSAFFFCIGEKVLRNCYNHWKHFLILGTSERFEWVGAFYFRNRMQAFFA